MKSVKTALLLVFRSTKYLVIALGVATLFIVLVTSIAFSSALAFSFRYGSLSSLPRTLIEIIWLNNTALSLTLFILTAALVGINIALMVFHIAKRLATAGLTSTGGIALAILGVGCASCGSVVLSSLLGATSATSVLSILPLRGTEFSLLAIVVLGISIVITSRRIIGPVSCSIRPADRS